MEKNGNRIITENTGFSFLSLKHLVLDKLNFENEVIYVEEAKVMFHCDGCDDEIVVGDEIFRIGLRRLCKQCLMEYALTFFSASMEVVR